MDNTNSSSSMLDGQSLLATQQSTMDCNEPSTSTNTRKKMFSTLPISRVNQIIRSCPNLTTVKKDAIVLTSMAAELFLQDLIKNVYKLSPDKANLTYNILADFIAKPEYSFLHEAIPQKITVRQYEELKRQNELDFDNDQEDSP
ncbi:chromatin accessibility complex protein 1-like protein [Euroglyphus maynei]|uniref:Chromatin accessibility complex protein 1-like protein n=1 Tax=Euroglyphus maynei TaxID=6958 RepID=A0A1Y3BKQ3_EURMA|nr:chromatin accessibility complex protein 1-like protein [Euroglyphus maynei]